ncbi:Regulatory protein AsnC [Ruegeria denitrificans]|uniref:Regulatory protein AsnC n=1 Tax=Ruegeria denitrificans TaxID=1715692 RepID=A0A0P1IQ53_9RHOB|nr:AsnC family transcriptional regulator [Ruegeria denitrificans]CUK18662.1 Regulatory protein AsnC [Ruegeria denitrificans]
MARESDKKPKSDQTTSTGLRQREAASLNDRLNQDIVRQLQKDGRTPFAEIAQNLNVSEGTIRNRVNAMKASGSLRIIAVTDSGASEYRTEAMVGIRIAAGHRPEDVAARLSALEEIVYVVWVSGNYDLLIEIVADDRRTFLSMLSRHIYGQEDIGSAEVMTGLMNFKNQFLLKSNWG